MSRTTTSLKLAINHGDIRPVRGIVALLIGMLLLAPTAALAAEKTEVMLESGVRG